MADVPHFALPFSYRADGAPKVNEQGGLPDLAACIEAALRTPIGSRKEIPDFGTADMVFRVQPIHLNEIMEQVSLHEPRAIMTWEQHPDLVDTLIARVTIDLTSAGEEEARG